MLKIVERRVNIREAVATAYVDARNILSEYQRIIDDVEITFILDNHKTIRNTIHALWRIEGFDVTQLPNDTITISFVEPFRPRKSLSMPTRAQNASNTFRIVVDYLLELVDELYNARIDLIRTKNCEVDIAGLTRLMTKYLDLIDIMQDDIDHIELIKFPAIPAQ